MEKIIIDDVGKEIQQVKVLDHVSMTMTAGKIYGLKGVNGSGKTMIMRMIAGLIYPTYGSITIDGKTLGTEISFPPSMGFMIEGPSFLGEYTGAENLQRLNEIRRRVPYEDICNTMEAVGLDPNDPRKYRKYSLGMKQRLGIAAAVFEKPELVLLDEPTNALDENGVERIRVLIKQLKRENTIVVLTCHDATFLQDVSDEVFHVEQGRVLNCAGDVAI